MTSKINIALIESYIGENFLTYKDFCKRCDISMPTFNKIKCGSSVRLTALVKIARTIDVPLERLLGK